MNLPRTGSGRERKAAPNRDRSARLSADSRHRCFDHATRSHTGRTGSKRTQLRTRPSTSAPAPYSMTLSSFSALSINPHGSTLASNPWRCGIRCERRFPRLTLPALSASYPRRVCTDFNGDPTSLQSPELLRESSSRRRHTAFADYLAGTVNHTKPARLISQVHSNR